jgi:hypothetical protein
VCFSHLQVVRRRGITRNHDTHRQIALLQAQYLTVFLIVSYLVLPGISSVLFRFFPCEDVDPENVVPGNQVYMRVDYSISCNSDRRQFGLVWVILMIFVYPIGILVFYFVLLYKVSILMAVRFLFDLLYLMISNTNSAVLLSNSLVLIS